MTLCIRLATEADRPALLEQFLGLNRYEDLITGDRRTDLAGAEATLVAGLADVAATGGQALVAELGGRVVGHLFVVIRMDHPYVREALRPYAYVTELFVRDEARGAGVGAALLAEAERVARARGVPRLGLGVLVGNGRAQALYERLGFAPYAVELCKELGGG